MRYKARNIAALQMALGSLPDNMRVEVDPDIEVSAKTVGELQGNGVAGKFSGHNTTGTARRQRSQGEQSEYSDAHHTKNIERPNYDAEVVSDRRDDRRIVAGLLTCVEFGMAGEAWGMAGDA
jgi:hypothetical protein